VLSKVLAGLHDRNGKVTIPGFYDGVSALPTEVKRQWQSLKFFGAQFPRQGRAVGAGGREGQEPCSNRSGRGRLPR